MQKTSLPLDPIGKPCADGTSQQTFRATTGGLGVTGITTDASFQEVVLPAGVECKVAYIQVQTITPSTFEPLDECYPFEWSHDGVEDGYLFSSYGKAQSIAKDGGSSLGYVKAVAGKKIVVYVES